MYNLYIYICDSLQVITRCGKCRYIIHKLHDALRTGYHVLKVVKYKLYTYVTPYKQLFKPTNEENMFKVLGYIIKTVRLIKFCLRSSYFSKAFVSFLFA